MHRKQDVRYGVMAAGWLCAMVTAATAGPNLIAIGNYGEVPYKQAEGRDSYNGKEIVYSFDDPEFDFGRVVVRSSEPLSKVRKDLFVGFTGGALVIDTRGTGGSGGGGNVRIDSAEIWLKVHGRIRPERSYEWEIELTGTEQQIRAFPAIVPAFWADGKPFGSEVIVRQPDDPDNEAGDHGDDRIRRLEYPHGVVKVPSFERQTGSAWVVLKPQDFGAAIGLLRFAFREVEESLAQDLKAGNPTPVRYIAIRSVLEDEIAAALEQSAKELKRFQNPDHYWQADNPENSVAVTSLVVAALAESDPSAEGLKEAMQWLARQEPAENQKWALATVAQRLYTLSRYGGLDDYRAAISSDAQAVVAAQLDDGGWAADPDAAGAAAGALRPRPDNTTSETALSALVEARFAGLELDGRVWRKAMLYWTEAQAFDGGFREKLERYGGVGQATTSAYTAIGAASLIRSVDMAAGVDGKRCNAYLASKSQLRAVVSALDWLSKNYREQFKDIGSLAEASNPYLEGSALQTLGAVSGIARFHDKDHFDETARLLLSMRDPGSGLFGWRDPQSGQWVQPPSFLRTAQAMFILASGAGPIACQRIIVGDDEGRYNEFNNDVAHLVRYLSKVRGRQFGWRRTSIDRDVRELAEVPFLFVNVVGPMTWGKPEWDKIRDYCLNGGTVILNLNEDQGAQRTALLDGIKTAFPEYKLGDLDENHPVFSAEKKLEIKPKLQAMGNGIRDFLFVPAESWSCRWHLYEQGDKDESLQFMSNLLTYGTDSSPLHSSFVLSTYAAGAASTLSMRAAHIEVGSKLPAYPSLIGALDRLMQANYRIRVEPVTDLNSADVVWVSVTGEEPPSEAVLGQLRSALTSGKYVFVDVVTGNKSWDEAFRAVLKSLGPNVVLENLRRNHPVYTGEVPGTQGFDAVEVAFRKALHQKKTTRGRAELYAILVDGRQVGVFSAHDLASGVGYNQFPDCRGPMPTDSRHVVMNVFLDAYQHRQMARAGR